MPPKICANISEKQDQLWQKTINTHSKLTTSYSHGFKKEGSSLKFNEAKSNKISWSDCRRIAAHHASLMHYEEVVRCCLDYLNRHLTAPSSKPMRILDLKRNSILFSLAVAMVLDGVAFWDYQSKKLILGMAFL
jgi:hypothetical protein